MLENREGVTEDIPEVNPEEIAQALGSKVEIEVDRNGKPTYQFKFGSDQLLTVRGPLTGDPDAKAFFAYASSTGRVGGFNNQISAEEISVDAKLGVVNISNGYDQQMILMRDGKVMFSEGGFRRKSPPPVVRS